jgi:two-component system, NarL family, nitrate/nitrite response regulator NarL
MARDVHLKNIVECVRGLSDREQQITNLVCDGLSNKVIATRLGVSEGTVKVHLHRIYTKLRIGSRSELIALASSRRTL